MTAWLAHTAALARHLLRETLGPWLFVSLSLHAGVIAAILPERPDDERPPAAGGAIAVEIVVMDGPDAQAAAGDTAPQPDRARRAERRPPAPVSPQATAAPIVAARAGAAGVAASAPTAPAAPVILAPRPRPKPAPPPVPATGKAEQAARITTPADAEPAAGPTAEPANPGGETRGASPQAGNPKPVYPDSARRRSRQGRVILRVEVGPDGAAGTVAVDESSGDADLDAAALDAVRRWRFRPALRNGFPVAAQVRVPVRFALQ